MAPSRAPGGVEHRMQRGHLKSKSKHVICMCIYTCIHTYTHTCMCMYIYIYMYLVVCINVYMVTYVYRCVLSLYNIILMYMLRVQLTPVQTIRAHVFTRRSRQEASRFLRMTVPTITVQDTSHIHP